MPKKRIPRFSADKLAVQTSTVDSSSSALPASQNLKKRKKTISQAAKSVLPPTDVIVDDTSDDSCSEGVPSYAAAGVKRKRATLDDFEYSAAKRKREMDQEDQENIEEDRQEDAEREVKLGNEIFGSEEDEDALEVADVKQRISDVVQVLKNFKEQSEGRSRTDYLRVLKKDLMRLYDYNEYLIDKFFEMLPPEDVVELVEANERERPLTIRVNTLRTKRRDLAQALAARGMHLQALERWSNVGLQIFDSKVAVGGTLEYLAGYYMLQSAVSFLPVMALDPQPEEKVLDLAAAPGGKTTHICSLMKNTGVVFANDVSAARSMALFSNVQRLGCSRVIMTCIDGRKYSKMYHNFFDRVLLDAPCSGTGIIARDKSVKTSKTADDIKFCVIMQKSLLLNAIDCCKVGGTIVYSTCSILVEENEHVVNYALKKRGVKIVDTGLVFGRPGYDKIREHRFHSDVTLSRRYFPHVHNMDGFFVCKFTKINDTTPIETNKSNTKGKGKGVKPGKKNKKNSKSGNTETAQKKKGVDAKATGAIKKKGVANNVRTIKIKTKPKTQ